MDCCGDYRDKAGRYINDMREELSATANALRQLLESLSQADCDHESNLRSALRRLREGRSRRRPPWCAR